MLDADFSQLAGGVLGGGYFRYSRYSGPDEKVVEWSDRLQAERDLLTEALIKLDRDKVAGRGYKDLPGPAKDVWDAAYKFMVSGDQPEQGKGEPDDSYDVRCRQEEPLTMRPV